MVPAPRHWENIIQVNTQIPDKRIVVRSQSHASVGWIGSLVYIIISMLYIRIKV